jgi:glycosyltransferase involved in cell wall biosynthesis
LTRRPRLLVVTSTLPARRGDGTPSFVWDLAEREAAHYDTLVLAPAVPGSALEERDGHVQIRRFRYFFRSYEDLADGAILENLRSHRSRWMQVPPFFAAEAMGLRRLMKQFQPDVMQVYWIVPQGLVASAIVRRVPWLLTSLGGDLYALDGPSARHLKRWVLKHPTAVTVMNEDMRRRAIALGADPSTTHVLPMGADLKAIRATPAQSRLPTRLLFAGRLVEKKGVEVLLRALEETDGDWSLDVVGEGPLRAALEAQAGRFGDRVRFLGTLDRPALARAMAECSVLLLPSVPASSGDQDGLPVVLLEALASGCAVVGSELPGITAAIKHEVNGLLVPAGDHEALRSAISRLLREPELARRLGRSAQGSSDSYSVDEIGRKYVDLLDDIRSRRGTVGAKRRRA